MENINPGLEFLWSIKHSIESSTSVRDGIQKYLETSRADFRESVQQLFVLHQHKKSMEPLLQSISSAHRRALLSLVARGLSGEPIHPFLCQLELEMIEACEAEIALKVQKLPMVTLAPLLLLVFPAFMILLIAPLMTLLAESM